MKEECNINGALFSGLCIGLLMCTLLVCSTGCMGLYNKEYTCDYSCTEVICKKKTTLCKDIKEEYPKNDKKDK